MFCSALFVMTWGLFLLILIIMHSAVGGLVPEIRNLPDNLNKGFKEGFVFKDLEQSALDVQTQASNALQKCGVITPATQCPASSSGNSACRCDTTAEKNQIDSIFSRTLDTIQKVTTDKYLGVSEFKKTADSLNDIKTELNKAPVGSTYCSVNIQVYCEMHTQADTLHGTVSSVNNEIDKLTDGDQIKTFKNNSNILNALHGLPYLMLFSMLLLSCFWCAEKPACCCCGGNVGPGCAFFWHLAFCFAFWLICVVFIVVRAMTLHAFETTTINQFEGNPTIMDLLNHIQNQWPEFWDIALSKFVERLDGFVNSMAAAMALLILIFIYSCGLCICCGKPYVASSAAVGDVQSVGVVPGK